MWPKGLTILQLDGHDLEAVRQDLRHIYEASFSSLERDPFDKIFASGIQPCVYGAWLDSTFVGFADLASLERTTVMLRYLAVAEPFRSRGIGRALLQVITGQLSGSVDRVVFEVPRTSATSDATAAVRRIEFYRRWEAHEMKGLAGYFYPSPLEVLERVPALLFERHVGSTECPSSEDLRRILRLIYRRCYGPTAVQLHLEELLTLVQE